MSSPSDDELDRLRTAGDDAADRFVTDLAARLGGLPALADALTAVTRWTDVGGAPPAGVPAEVVDFVNEPPPPPPAWIDDATIARAQALFQECRYAGLVVLACGSLPACYAQPNIADVLSASGRLLVDVRRRLHETVAFTSIVMTPGSLAPGGAGLKWIRKVRLMHAMMRPLKRADPAPYQTRIGDELADLLLRRRWSDAHLAPVNQVELGFVLLTFSWLALRGWERLGIALSERERGDYLRAWAWIGRQLGITDPLLCYVEERGAEAAAAEALYERIRERYELGTEAGQLLTAALGVIIVEQQSQALREMILPGMPPWLARVVAAALKWAPHFTEECAIAMSRGLIRRLTGLPTARQLRVGRSPLLYWLPGVLVSDSIRWRTKFRGQARSGGLYAALGRLIDASLAFDRASLRR